MNRYFPEEGVQDLPTSSTVGPYISLFLSSNEATGKLYVPRRQFDHNCIKMCHFIKQTSFSCLLLSV